MSKLKISLYLTALFLAGVVTGSFLTHQIGKRIVAHMMQPSVMAEHWRRDLEGKLRLTPDQSQKIKPIIADGMETFRSAFHDQMQISLSNCNARIAVELTPEQRAKFAEVEKEQQEFIRSRFKKENVPSDF